MQLADRAWNEGNVQVAHRLLVDLQPAPSQLDIREFDWFHLWRRVSSEVRRLHVPGVALDTIAVSPDGRTVAVGGRPWGLDENPAKSVYLFSVADGTLLKVLHGHSGPVNAVAFHPVKGWLVSASEGEVRIWREGSFEPLRLLIASAPIILGFPPMATALP